MDLGPLRAYTWALVLGVLVPVSWVLDLILGPGVVVFAVAGVAIIPLAWFLGLATEELGKHAGPGVGGLLNATFGNATELIIAIFAGMPMSTTRMVPEFCGVMPSLTS